MEIWGLSAVWSVFILIAWIFIIITLVIGAMNTKAIIANQKINNSNRAKADISMSRMNILMHNGYIFTSVFGKLKIYNKNKTINFDDIETAWYHYVDETNAKHGFK